MLRATRSAVSARRRVQSTRPIDHALYTYPGEQHRVIVEQARCLVEVAAKLGKRARLKWRKRGG